MHQAGLMKKPAGQKTRNGHWCGVAGEQELILEISKALLDLTGSWGNDRTLWRI